MALLEEEPAPGVPEWIVTFGDMMSLLLTFFIMLVSLSEIKSQEKYQAMVESMTRQFGYDNSANAMIPGRHKPRNSAIAKLATLGRAMKYDIVQGGSKQEAPKGDHDRVRTMRPGDRTAVGTVIYYSEESPVLTADHKAELYRLALEISGKPQIIEVRGHTSLRPAEQYTQYQDNWELAYARCRGTFDFLVDEIGIDPRRIRMSIAGASEPLHLSTDPELLRKNPRVEVYLTDETVDDRASTEEERNESFLKLNPDGTLQ